MSGRPTSDSAGHKTRTDIQALRAIAVGAVVIYHLWPRLLPGGFVGVDVFFVISGFLITKHLVDGLLKDGSIGLGTFWARRAKRLLPASMLAAAGALVGTIAFVPLSRWGQFFDEVVASTFYVQNWRLAGDTVDYLAADNAPSAVQHYWSLSVEEQFYVGLPMLLLLTFYVARRRGWDIRRTLGVSLSVLAASSLAYSVWLTGVAAPIAYFSTFTRWWEFALGGLLALSRVHERGVVRHRLVGWVGVGMIAFAAFGFNDATPFPSFTAIVPVLGAAIAIAVRSTDAWSVSALGRIGVVRYLGDVSYGIYLWHWPLVVIAPYALDGELTFAAKLLLLVATVGLAGMSKRFVEDPIRFGPRLLGESRPRVIGLASVASMGVIVMLVFAGHALFSARTGLAASAPEGNLACFGASAAVKRGCEPWSVTGPLVPEPSLAGKDSYNLGDCWSREDVAVLNVCDVGLASAKKTIFVVGDSHSNVLLAAYEIVAATNNWRFRVAGHNGCYWTQARQVKRTKAMESACNAWSERVSEHVAVESYDAVIATYAAGREEIQVPSGTSVEEATIRGIQDAWSVAASRGIRVIGIRDVPVMRSSIVECVERHRLRSNIACSDERSVALRHFSGLVDAAARTEGAGVVDFLDTLCDAKRCFPVVGNVVAYQDPDHLSATFVRTLAPILAERLKAIIG